MSRGEDGGLRQTNQYLAGRLPVSANAARFHLLELSDALLVESSSPDAVSSASQLGTLGAVPVAGLGLAHGSDHGRGGGDVDGGGTGEAQGGGKADRGEMTAGGSLAEVDASGADAVAVSAIPIALADDEALKRLGSSKINAALKGGLMYPEIVVETPRFAAAVVAALAAVSDKKALRALYALLPPLARQLSSMQLLASLIRTAVAELDAPSLTRRLWGIRMTTSVLRSLQRRIEIADNASALLASALDGVAPDDAAHFAAELEELVILGAHGGRLPISARSRVSDSMRVLVEGHAPQFLSWLVGLVGSLDDRSQKKGSRLRHMFGRSSKLEPALLQAHAFTALGLVFPRAIEGYPPLVAGLASDSPDVIRASLHALRPFAQSSPSALLGSMQRFLQGKMLAQPESPGGPLTRRALVRLLHPLLSEVDDPHMPDVLRTLLVLAADAVPMVAVAAVDALVSLPQTSLAGTKVLRPPELPVPTSSSDPLPALRDAVAIVSDAAAAGLSLDSFIVERLALLLATNCRVQQHRVLRVVEATARRLESPTAVSALTSVAARVRALAGSRAAFVSAAALSALVWCAPGACEARHVVLAFEAALSARALSARLLAKVFTSLASRVLIAPALAAPALALIATWARELPESVDPDMIVNFLRKLIRVGATKAARSEYKEAALSAVFGMLDLPRRSGPRAGAALCRLHAALFWWLGEHANYLIGERQEQTASLDAALLDEAPTATSSPAMRAVVARLEHAVATADREGARLAALALAKLALRSGDPLRIQVYEFLHMASADPGLRLYWLLAPVLSLLDEAYSARAELARRLDAAGGFGLSPRDLAWLREQHATLLAKFGGIASLPTQFYPIGIASARLLGGSTQRRSTTAASAASSDHGARLSASPDFGVLSLELAPVAQAAPPPQAASRPNSGLAELASAFGNMGAAELASAFAAPAPAPQPAPLPDLPAPRRPELERLDVESPRRGSVDGGASSLATSIPIDSWPNSRTLDESDSQLLATACNYSSSPPSSFCLSDSDGGLSSDNELTPPSSRPSPSVFAPSPLPDSQPASQPMGGVVQIGHVDPAFATKFDAAFG
ncbi:uncharacterized protein AMSG_05390 [Thecamonas trahens ATCC 50062]|uniref:Uncharacterized protein n=1 Tax=Thecamonas trahens ATCC 50062 TaxID=461836 RepID=A0A0L0DAX7_THETB|nr:hypothetical protein AMSG_05390 [Thecamonas trahens ATCC 50062]KNC49390.1 hypothetical protein AMSG_05390 [Thecamonas trahens ATCC 50062]|eukprot:XP_013757815.1 hypothetical protein AMSG_05390 [Thecamonas trahens ATCC 50062]